MKNLNYIELIDEIEDVEQIKITTPKYRRCCYNLLEILKLFVKILNPKLNNMTDKDKDNEDGGFHLSTDGLNCLPCRCRRNLYHKATVKTTDENNITTINIVEDRSSFEMGRGITPDNNIFRPEENQLGSVAVCDTGWGSKQITPEELEERVEKIETDLERIDEDVNKIKKNYFNSLD